MVVQMHPFGNILAHILTFLNVFSQQPTITPHPTLTPTPTVVQKMLSYTNTMRMDGKSAKITVSAPENGGAITGTISGDCNGTISGKYLGEKGNKEFVGKADASCQIFVVSITGRAAFSGKVSSDDTQATISYTGQAANNTKSGQVTIPLTTN